MLFKKNKQLDPVASDLFQKLGCNRSKFILGVATVLYFFKILYYYYVLQIMAERKNAKAMACSSLQERTNVTLDVPLQGTVCHSSCPWEGPGLETIWF